MVSPDSVPSTGAGGGAQAPQEPVQEGITAPDLAKRDEQLTQLQQQFAEFKSNASRREGELTRERDAAKKAIELGEDSDEYKSKQSVRMNGNKALLKWRLLSWKIRNGVC